MNHGSYSRASGVSGPLDNRSGFGDNLEMKSILSLSTWLFSAVFLGFGFMPFLSAATVSEEPFVFIPPRAGVEIRAIIPASILHHRMEEPFADFVVRVGLDGQMIDGVCVEASNPELIARGRRQLERTRFQAGMINGEPVVADLKIRVNFYHPTLELDGVVNQSGMDHVQNHIYSMGDNPFHYTVSRAGELDRPLAIAERGDIYVPTDEEGEKLLGQARVEFYIDHDGHPRMPKVIDANHEMVGEAAILTVQQWRFEPPQADRKPTVVKVLIPVNFN